MSRVVDPSVQIILDNWNAAGREPLECVPPAKARADADAMALSMGLTPPEVLTQDIGIETSNGLLKARAYRPTDHAERPALPALLYFHGGGFVVGSIETHDVLCRYMAATTNACIISVDYRLAPENPFPAAVVDANACACWMLQRATDLRIDPENFAVGGDSAGACLAAGLALQQGNDGVPNWRLQVLIYPLVDWRQQQDSYTRNGSGFLLTSTTMAYFRDQYLRNPGDQENWLASPLLAPNHSNAPAAYLLTAELDPLCDEGLAYAQCLHNAGVSVQLREVPGMIHGFITMSKFVPAATEYVDELCAALKNAWLRHPTTTFQ